MIIKHIVDINDLDLYKVEFKSNGLVELICTPAGKPKNEAIHMAESYLKSFKKHLARQILLYKTATRSIKNL